MDSEKIGKIIKNIRLEYHLTQQELADKLGVTYQAVSKWENGKNMPDIAILKEISKEFHLDFNELVEGKQTKKKRSIKLSFIILLCLMIAIILGVIIYLKPQDTDFEFKTLSSNCTNFNISGSIAYNQEKSHIYISEVDYCGGNDTTIYEKIECSLYETDGTTETKIDSYESQSASTLEEFLKQITFHVDNYASTCKEYTNASIFLQVTAIDKENNNVSYRIPLNLESLCSTES